MGSHAARHAPVCTQVVLFSDLHGHSRKENVFSYGCAKVGVALPECAGSGPEQPANQ